MNRPTIRTKQHTNRIFATAIICTIIISINYVSIAGFCQELKAHIFCTMFCSFLLSQLPSLSKIGHTIQLGGRLQLLRATRQNSLVFPHLLWIEVEQLGCSGAGYGNEPARIHLSCCLATSTPYHQQTNSEDNCQCNGELLGETDRQVV